MTLLSTEISIIDKEKKIQIDNQKYSNMLYNDDQYYRQIVCHVW